MPITPHSHNPFIYGPPESDFNQRLGQAIDSVISTLDERNRRIAELEASNTEAKAKAEEYRRGLLDILKLAGHGWASDDKALEIARKALAE